MKERDTAFYAALNVVLYRRINTLMSMLENKPNKEITFEEWLEKYHQYETYKRLPELEFLESSNLLGKLALMLRDIEVVTKGELEEQKYEFELESLRRELGPIRSNK